LSRRITDVSRNSTDDVFGVVPYVDPRCLNNIKNKNEPPYKLNTKSDVYSVGVLLWQISSGCEPFNIGCGPSNKEESLHLISDIKKGKREQIVKGTPVKYSDLYEGIYMISII
jgi:hypothetical protein